MQSLGALFKETVTRYPKKTAILFKQNGRYIPQNWEDLSKRVYSAAAYFMKLGVEPGDRIAILSENRPEWAVVDLAALMVGAMTVPIYTSLSPAEISYILKDCGAKALAVSNRILFEKIIPIQKDLPELKTVIAFEPAVAVSSEDLKISLVYLHEMEKEAVSTTLEERLKTISADASASIIYTSGTTGPPKGVVLTHGNFIHNVTESGSVLNMGPTDIHLSFLPLSHVFERMAGHYLMIKIGAIIAYAESMDTVPQNLLEVRPTFIVGVPRFFEKIQARVLEQVEKAGSLRRALFFWAKDIGRRKRLLVQDKKRPGPRLALQLFLARKLVYSKFRKRLGGRIRFCVAGGAPLSREIAEFFYDLGVMIFEGYGLTETSPVIAANREGRFKFGTVGIPLNGIEVALTPEGEIITKSPSVMKGYYHKPAETEAVLKDGWFYTGDLGSIDKEGYLSITGRKKELIVTSGGKKVAPRAIEELIESDPVVLRCVLFGEGKKFITAFIVADKEKLLEMANGQKIAYKDYAALIADSRVYKILETRIAELSKNLANYEKIKYFALLENDFSQAAGELTPTLKVKREVICQRYKDKLLPFYEKAQSE